MSRILVTGASTGLGLLTATTLAQEGHEVVLHARNPTRLDSQTVPTQIHDVLYGDLSDVEQTRQVAVDANRLGRFDVVIHNAGVMDASAALAVNVVAPFLLTALMQRPDRIIVLSSSMHLSGTPRLGDAFTRGPVSYETAKLYETTLAFALTRRWPHVLVHAVDPGWVPTRMGGPSASDDLTEGHRTQEWLATADAADIHPRTGGYWHHHATRRPHPAALDPEFQDTLLHALETHTGLALPG